MTEKKRPSRAVDVLLILMMVLPLITAVVLNVLTAPAKEGIVIEGARVYYSANPDADLSQVFSTDFILTDAQINSWLVMISITGLCLFLTHGLQEHAVTVRQHIAEWIVEKVEGLVRANMGDFHVQSFSAFVCAVLGLSVFSSLMSLLGVFAPTSDLSVVGGWALLVFLVITGYKACCGPRIYVRTFTSDGAVVAALNVIGEVAAPISIAFRHYGNVMSGAVIAVLVSAFLQWLSSVLLGWLPGVLGEIPFLQVGLPAILSVYFDLFSGALQAYIFSMLTMLYVSGGFPLEEYIKRHSHAEKSSVLAA